MAYQNSYQCESFTEWFLDWALKLFMESVTENDISVCKFKVEYSNDHHTVETPAIFVKNEEDSKEYEQFKNQPHTDTASCRSSLLNSELDSSPQDRKTKRKVGANTQPSIVNVDLCPIEQRGTRDWTGEKANADPDQPDDIEDSSPTRSIHGIVPSFFTTSGPSRPTSKMQSNTYIPWIKTRRLDSETGSLSSSSHASSGLTFEQIMILSPVPQAAITITPSSRHKIGFGADE